MLYFHFLVENVVSNQLKPSMFIMSKQPIQTLLVNLESQRKDKLVLNALHIVQSNQPG
jgi:hypothetical protein